MFAWKSFINHVNTIELPVIWGLLTTIKGVIYQYTKFDDDFKISGISLYWAEVIDLPHHYMKMHPKCQMVTGHWDYVEACFDCLVKNTLLTQTTNNM